MAEQETVFNPLEAKAASRSVRPGIKQAGRRDGDP